MLGNIRFVGALLARKMLASKVLIAIAEELLSDPTPEALESLAALLTTTGPVFDKPEWSYRPVLNHFFEKVEAIIKSPTCEPRAKCLVKDLLDLRKAGWRSSRPQRQERPKTLEEVAQEQAGGAAAGANQTARSPAVLRQPPSGILQRLAAAEQSAPTSKNTKAPVEEMPAKVKRDEPRSQTPPSPSANGKGSSTPPELPLHKAQPAFDRETFRKEVSKALAELRYSGDGTEMASRLAEQCPPPARCQPEEFSHLLVRAAEEGKAEVRKMAFTAVVALFTSTTRRWSLEAAAEGLRMFVEEACEELRCDVPALPRILAEELHPALKPLVDSLPEAKGSWEALIA
jgi:hypothetical protein